MDPYRQEPEVAEVELTNCLHCAKPCKTMHPTKDLVISDVTRKAGWVMWGHAHACPDFGPNFRTRMLRKLGLRKPRMVIPQDRP